MARKKNNTEEVVVEESIITIPVESNEPTEIVEEIVEEPIMIEEPVNETGSIFTNEQKAWIIKCISDGYHYKDVLKRSRVYLSLTPEQFEILSKNVVRVEDIYRNIEGK